MSVVALAKRLCVACGKEYDDSILISRTLNDAEFDDNESHVLGVGLCDSCDMEVKVYKEKGYSLIVEAEFEPGKEGSLTPFFIGDRGYLKTALLDAEADDFPFVYAEVGALEKIAEQTGYSEDNSDES